MKWFSKYLIFIFIFLFTINSSYAVTLMFVKKKTDSTPTNYVNDANCIVAYYMNDESGEADESTTGEDLTQQGTISRETNVPSGYSGYSRQAASITQHLYSSDGGATDIYGADQEISVCTWFYLNSFTGDRYLAGKSAGAGNRSWFFYTESDDSSLQAMLSGDATNQYFAKGGTTINDSTWYHGCFVYNDTDLRIYLNGSLDSNGSNNPLAYTSGFANSSNLFTVMGLGSQWIYGYLDEFIMFDRALSAAEVNEIYTYGIDGTKGGND